MRSQKGNLIKLTHNCFILLQVFPETIHLQLCLLSILCILVSVSVCGILFSYYRTVPNIKKNIVTRLDELLILNSTFVVCFQCSVCLLSLLCGARNDYIYLAFFTIIYGSLAIGFGVFIGLSFSRVLIILYVSIQNNISRQWVRWSQAKAYFY